MSKIPEAKTVKAEVQVKQTVDVTEAPKAVSPKVVSPRELSKALVARCQEIRFPKLHPSNRAIYNQIVELDQSIKV